MALLPTIWSSIVVFTRMVTREKYRVGPVYTLATDCDASVNADGQVFTPISTAFCPHELSWSESITLMSAIRRVATRTGYFWFDTSVYHDNNAAMVPHWIDQFLQICHELLLCSREGRCQGLKKVMAEFVQNHLDKKHVETWRLFSELFPTLAGTWARNKLVPSRKWFVLQEAAT